MMQNHAVRERHDSVPSGHDHEYLYKYYNIPCSTDHLNACSVCYCCNLSTIMFTCGHTTCAMCSTKIHTCPQCRTDIVKRIHFYVGLGGS